jgi:hypothetical protein
MIVASMCTIPIRKNCFIKIVKRILYEQTVSIDQLHVRLNGYNQIDGDLPKDKRIQYYLEPQNPGPQARYIFENWLADNSIVLTLDDDLIYPKNYVELGLSSIKKYSDNTSICFGGVYWDWVVPVKNLEYHAHKRLIPYTGKLEKDTPVPVLLGGAAFHNGKVFKKLASHELKKFATNDDLMASFNIQRSGYRIISIAKQSNWIMEMPEQNSDKSLYRSDISARKDVFRKLVMEYGFIPWVRDNYNLEKRTSYLVISSGEIKRNRYHLKSIKINDKKAFHTLEIIEGDIGSLSSRILRSHEEHFVYVPSLEGRWKNKFIIQKIRFWRVQKHGSKLIKQYLKWLFYSLNITDIVIVENKGSNWIKDIVVTYTNG